MYVCCESERWSRDTMMECQDGHEFINPTIASQFLFFIFKERCKREIIVVNIILTVTESEDVRHLVRPLMFSRIKYKKIEIIQ